VLLSRVPSEVANERVEYLAGYASVWSPSVRLIRHVPLRRDFRLTRERYAIKREQDPGFSGDRPQGTRTDIASRGLGRPHPVMCSRVFP